MDGDGHVEVAADSLVSAGARAIHDRGRPRGGHDARARAGIRREVAKGSEELVLDTHDVQPKRAVGDDQVELVVLLLDRSVA